MIDLLSAFSTGVFEKAEPVFRLKGKSLLPGQFEKIVQASMSLDLSLFLTGFRQTFFPEKKFGGKSWEQFIGLTNNEKDLSRFLNALRLGKGTDLHQKDLEAVSLMTLHASKGLEFDAVFIPGCENGLLPYNLYGKEMNEAEEKRLMYVGMTRARKLLFLSHAQHRILAGRKFSLPKSPFLQFIQEELIRHTKNEPSKKSKDQDNQLSLIFENF